MKNKTNKILFISHSGDLYGAERSLLDLILNLDNKIYPVVILPKKGLFYDTLIANSIEVHLIQFRGWWYRKFRIKMFYRLLFNLCATFRIVFLIKNLNIKLIYTNTSYAPIGLIVSRFLSIPHLTHLHEFLNLNDAAKFDLGLKTSMKYLNRNTDIIIATSYAHKNDLQRYLNESKIRVVYNGIKSAIDIDYELKSEICKENIFKILMVGSISQNKGQLIALKALNILIKKGLQVQICFVGDYHDHDYYNLLNDYIHSQKLLNNVIFKGFQEEVERYYIDSNLLLVCSKQETFGRVIIEAMSFSCPVISTRLPAVEEIIDNGFNGLLFNHNDHQYLATCIEKLQKDSNFRNQLSNNGLLTYNKKFTFSKYIKSIHSIFFANFEF